MVFVVWHPRNANKALATTVALIARRLFALVGCVAFFKPVDAFELQKREQD